MSTLITLTDITLAFGHHELLSHAHLTITDNERIGLIGRNGAGKSSLLKILDGRILPDDGEVACQSGLRVMMIEQEPVLDPEQTIYAYLTAGMQEDEDWSRGARADELISQLNLDGQARIAGLSGGTKKRIALARGFLLNPALLLLDEPTNHLDLDGIRWLEQSLISFKGSAVVITHDRRFLDNTSTRIVELDRGELHSFPGNFAQWQERKTAWLEAQEQQHAKFDKFLAQEEVWIRKGIEARRTRNEGRVRRLEALRLERANRRDRVGNVNFQIDGGERSGKLVAELIDVSKSFQKPVVSHYSTTIMRGDRIGILGANGVGKTTLIKLMLGELKPDTGKVKLGTNLNIAYFDQMREQLDEQATLMEVISPGSEWVEIAHQRKHVMSYLGDFLFSPERAKSPVSSLSGGERARLLLARLFARPANVLVMDEPTNDLDIETLELLESLLQDYEGTVLIVSHDRAFLENVVTQSIVYQGEGVWRDEVGIDWSQVKSAEFMPSVPKIQKTAVERSTQKPKSTKLGQYEEKELAAIPDKIAALEVEQAKLNEELSDPDLYTREDAAERSATLQSAIQALEDQIMQLMQRWEVLEQRKQGG